MATFIEDSKRSEYWEPSYEYGIIRQRKESAKPKGEQRPVPTLSEIAQDIGLSRNAMSNISTNTLRQLTLKTGGKIIAAVRRRGFPMEVSDLVAYRAPKNEAGK